MSSCECSEVVCGCDVEPVGAIVVLQPVPGEQVEVRVLSDGEKYEVIKNYYTQSELHRIFEPYSKELEVHEGKCFWWVKYKTNKNE